MKWLRFAVFIAAGAAIVVVGEFGFGRLPAVGKLLNPAAGFWQNGTANEESLSNRHFPELRENVTIAWDNRRVPHVFAENEADLYFAQGYVMARDRLWEMDFLTYVAAGRLSEILGKDLLEFDRFRRRIGLPRAAENAVEAMQGSGQAWLVAQSFAAGVNARIAELKPATYPLEYKILGYAPEPWSPLKSALILKYMAWNLTGRFSEKELSRSREAFSDAEMQAVYPYFPPFVQPIIPRGTRWPFTPVPLEKARIETAPSADNGDTGPESPFIDGSNNWAVAGSRTASGAAMLCNDPHLGLNLPSIWYEIQLAAPGLSVYGVTIPGSPGVIIGFNDYIAWGVTNAGSDVLDWYQVEFQDKRHAAYKYDGSWWPVTKRIEEYRIKGGAAVRDTLIYTHLGPVVYLPGEKPFQSNVPVGAAMRWTAHDPSREMLTFLKLNRARNYDEFLEALSFYDCPAQNFAYADVAGNIAIWHAGKFPLRPRGQGRFVEYGADSQAAWRGWIPRAHNPHILNPAQGFVSSANQPPADSTYPYYLGWDYAPFERSTRINEVLGASRNITPQDMMALQRDAVNLRARMLLPVLLPLLPADSLSAEQEKCAALLREWDYRSVAHSAAPLVFERWWRELYNAIWVDDIARSDGDLDWPRRDVTMDIILHHRESRFIDDRSTPRRETLAELVLASFRRAAAALLKQYGPPGDAWAWGTARGTDIAHLARMPGLGRQRLATEGDYGIVNATGRTHGPSWRMIVEMRPGDVRAWGIYPGGQAGNPGSPHYDEFVDDWVRGNYYPLLFMKSAMQADPRLTGKTLLRGGK